MVRKLCGKKHDTQLRAEIMVQKTQKMRKLFSQSNCMFEFLGKTAEQYNI